MGRGWVMSDSLTLETLCVCREVAREGMRDGGRGGCACAAPAAEPAYAVVAEHELREDDCVKRRGQEEVIASGTGTHPAACSADAGGVRVTRLCPAIALFGRPLGRVAGPPREPPADVPGGGVIGCCGRPDCSLCTGADILDAEDAVCSAGALAGRTAASEWNREETEGSVVQPLRDDAHTRVKAAPVGAFLPTGSRSRATIRTHLFIFVNLLSAPVAAPLLSAGRTLRMRPRR